MNLFEPVSLGTNLCKGYSLSDALDLVRECGFEYAELSSIINMCEHIDPKDITEEYAAQLGGAITVPEREGKLRIELWIPLRPEK